VWRYAEEAAEEIEKLKVDAAAAEARMAQYEATLAESEARGAQWSGQKGVMEGSKPDFEKNCAAGGRVDGTFHHVISQSSKHSSIDK
jgi:hypothetical protein